MPAPDKYHDVVVRALERDGWAVQSPYPLSYEERRVQIDVGAEKLVAASRGTARIAVEIKTFGSASPVTDLKEAVGTFVMYKEVLKELDPERRLYIAVPIPAYDTIFQEWLGQILVRDVLRSLLVYDVTKEKIVRWQPEP